MLRIVGANEASWDDIQAVFGTRGPAATCQCQRYKLRPRESFGSFPAEERAFRLRELLKRASLSAHGWTPRDRR